MNLSLSLQKRRQQLSQLFDYPVILWSGKSLSRNFPANHYPFRANSHFLYFAGLQLENAVIFLERGKFTLFMDNPPPSATLWHGETKKREEIAQIIGADAAHPLEDLKDKTIDAATIPVQDLATYHEQCHILGRNLSSAQSLQNQDLKLAQAIVHLRLSHDAIALKELKKAAQVSIKAHQAGIKATLKSKTEADIRSAMEAVIIAHNMGCAYNSIVTIQGEILHSDRYYNQLQPGDLLLADVGAETASGWAADITRTWSVSGKFSPTQRDIYNVVLAAHDTCIEQIRPGIEYRDIHLLAAKIIAEGLADLGILRGNPEDLVAQDAHALFFPHGIGHLLGLDVHDMEDLGDIAGYETERTRSDRFGLRYLRLDRKLRSQMLITIEPGFYQVPAILNKVEFRQKYQNVVNWERLADFADVRGIRIEDDVLVTESGHEILTAQLPTQIKDIESLMSNVEL